MTKKTVPTIEYIMYNNNWINKVNKETGNENDVQNGKCYEKTIPAQSATWYLFLILSLFGQSFGGAFMKQPKQLRSDSKILWRQLFSSILLIYDLLAFILFLIISLYLNTYQYINLLFHDSLHNKSLVYILLRTYFHLLLLEYISIKITSLFFGENIMQRINNIGILNN